jgi:photosystem II stability/assembly factor-like uncharacterized protein
MKTRSARWLAAVVIALALSLSALAPAFGQGLPCQADLEYYGLLPGTEKVYKGSCATSWTNERGGKMIDKEVHTVTQTVKKVSANGQVCKIELSVTFTSTGKGWNGNRTIFIYISEGKLYGEQWTASISQKLGDNPDYSNFGKASDWYTYFLDHNLGPQSTWKSARDSGEECGKQYCSGRKMQNISTPAGSFSNCSSAHCVFCTEGDYFDFAFKEKTGLVKIDEAGDEEQMSCNYELASFKPGEGYSATTITPPPPPPTTTTKTNPPPTPPNNSGASKGGSTSPSSTGNQPPIRLQGKDFTMCSDEATIKAIYPGAQAEGNKLVLELANMDKVEFTFDHDRLVKVYLNSQDIGGPSGDILEFENWLQSKYGKGKDIKLKDPQNIWNFWKQWKIGDTQIILYGHFSEVTGDLLMNYGIECPASACATPTVAPPPPSPVTPPPPPPPTTVVTLPPAAVPTGGSGSGTVMPVFVPVSLVDAGVINELAADRDVTGKLYAATSVQGILVSLDGGKTWQKCGWSYGPAIRVITLSGEVLALSPANGLYKSSDGGAAWTGAKPSESGISFTCVTWPTNSIIYVGTNRGVFCSDNAGKTWKLITAGQAVRWVDAREDKPERVFVLFETGELVMSKDSGQVWNPLTRDPANLRFYRTIGATPIFFLIRSDGKLMCSTDFGASWILVSGFTGEPRCIKCLSGCKCLGLLTASGLFQSCDNGKTWELIRSTEGKDLTSLLVTDNGEIIIGGSGVIRKPATIVDQKMLGDVNFKTGSADLTPVAQAELDGIAATLQQKPGLRVRVEGHTDNVGGDDYNLDLSRRRAESVKDYLVNKGLSADRFETQGYGKAYPIADNNTDQGRAQNRRVVVYLLD